MTISLRQWCLALLLLAVAGGALAPAANAAGAEAVDPGVAVEGPGPWYACVGYGGYGTEPPIYTEIGKCAGNGNYNGAFCLHAGVWVLVTGVLYNSC